MNGVVLPSGIDAKFVHEADGHVDIGSRGDFTRYFYRESAYGGGYHEQCRDELRTHATRHSDATAARKRLACDAQGRKTFFSSILNVGPELPQGIDQRGNGAVVHAIVTAECDCAALLCGEICGEKAHGGAGSTHIDGVTIDSKRLLHSSGVVALCEIENAERLGTQHSDEQQPIADALGCRQCNGAIAAPWCCEPIVHARIVK